MQAANERIPGPDPSMVRLARALFRPLARLFLRNGMNYHELKTVLGWSLVHAAMKDAEFAIPGRGVFRHSISHAAARTGMTRREATLFANMPEPEIDAVSERTRRAMRVLSAWRTEPGYQDENGEPLVLALRGPAPSFEALAEKERRDVPCRAIADVLVAEGNARWEGRSLRMLSPLHGSNNVDAEGREILADISGGYLRAVDAAFNDAVTLKPRFRQAAFSDIAADQVDELREELHGMIDQFNTQMNSVLDRHRARPGQEAVKVGVGSYSFFEQLSRSHD